MADDLKELSFEMENAVIYLARIVEGLIKDRPNEWGPMSAYMSVGEHRLTLTATKGD